MLPPAGERRTEQARQSFHRRPSADLAPCAAPRHRQGRRGAFYGRLSFRRSSSGLSAALFLGLARDLREPPGF